MKHTNCLALRCYSNYEGYDADCDFAVVDMTPELVTRLAKRQAMIKLLHELDDRAQYAEFWDYTPCAYSLTDDTQEVFEQIGDGDWCCPDDPLDLPATAIPRTECWLLVVSPTDFHWTFHPKHSGITMETATFKLEDLNGQDT